MTTTSYLGGFPARRPCDLPLLFEAKPSGMIGLPLRGFKVCCLLEQDMGLLSATWRVHASGVDDLEMIESGLNFLTGGCCEVIWTKDKSFHGSPQHVAMARTEKKKDAVSCFGRLGVEVLNELSKEGIEKRIDGEKTIHVRISLSELCRGRVSLIDSESRGSIVKGTFKIEAYPGDDPVEMASRLVNKLCSEG